MGRRIVRSRTRATGRLPRLVLAASLASGALLGAVGALGATPSASAAGAAMYEGLFVNSQSVSDVQSLASQLGVPVNTITVYADGSAYNSYSPSSGPLTLLLGVGALTPSQATSIGQSLVATGHADTIWRIMWEMNQNVSGWFDPWNQNAMSASSYIATFQAIVNAARAVPGENFKFMWNPNGGTGNENAGRTWNDTYPGDAYVDMVGIDQYDYSGYQANFTQVESFAQQHGKAFAIPEWGLDGSDDPAYINYVSSLCHSGNVALEAYFEYQGSMDTWLGDFPNSEAAFSADFATPITTGAPVTTPPTTTPPTTTPPTTVPVTTPPTTVPVTTPPTTVPVTTPPTTTTPPSTTTTVPSAPPAVPTGLSAAVSGSTVTLSWTNPAGTLGDDVFRDGSEIAWPGWPNGVVSSYQDTGVAAGSHTYTVAAYNSDGLGAQTAVVTAVVAPAAPPTTVPVTTPPTTVPVTTPPTTVPVTTPPTTAPPTTVPVTTPPAGTVPPTHQHGHGGHQARRHAARRPAKAPAARSHRVRARR